jgi:hypothetical protein
MRASDGARIVQRRGVGQTPVLNPRLSAPLLGGPQALRPRTISPVGIHFLREVETARGRQRRSGRQTAVLDRQPPRPSPLSRSAPPCTIAAWAARADPGAVNHALDRRCAGPGLLLASV